MPAAVSVEVTAVSGRRDLKAFIDLPFRLHANHPLWVPPLKLERRLFLNRRMNAFFTPRRSRVLPRPPRRARGGAHQRPGQPRLQRPPDEALGLVRLPRVRGRPGGARRRCWTPPRRGCASAAWSAWSGPADFAMNDESGVLIEGFELRPMILQPWHPPYYQQRMEQAGMAKAMDLLMWNLEVTDRDKVLPVIWELAEKVAVRARHPRAPDAPPPAAQRPRRLRRGLQLGVVEELGLRARTPRRTSTPTRRSCSSRSTSTGS